MSVKITSLELENVKRVQAVSMELSENGLTIIGGDNAQGKTSILDGIVFALGGERYRPSNLQHDGALATARIELKLSNGLVVVREGKNATLKVTDPTGAKAGQKLLDALIDELALNLPKFLNMKDTDKADVLLRILGIGDQLEALEKEERKAADERLLQGRVADQKVKYYKEMAWHADVPDVPVSAADIIASVNEVQKRNQERAAERQRRKGMFNLVKEQKVQYAGLLFEVEELEKKLAEKKKHAEDFANAMGANEQICLSFEALPLSDDETTEELQKQLADIENINAKVRDNLNKAKAKDDAEEHQRVYDALTAKVEDVRSRRKALLEGAAMPLSGLSIENGVLTYNGKAWDCMSGSEQIKTSIAIIRKLKPECGFVLLDKLEMLDAEQLKTLNAWMTEEGLQGIGTRVSRGEECTIIIEDGMIKKQELEW